MVAVLVVVGEGRWVGVAVALGVSVLVGVSGADVREGVGLGFRIGVGVTEAAWVGVECCVGKAVGEWRIPAEHAASSRGSRMRSSWLRYGLRMVTLQAYGICKREIMQEEYMISK